MKSKTVTNTQQPAIYPKVSIVVPVYGVEKYLQKCIDSLTTQTLQDIEIILVDDGSKDGSGKICDQNELLRPDLIKVIHQVNTGLGGARNAGIKAARAKYVMFVDSDDYLRSDAVKIAYEAVVGNDVDVVAFGIHFINETGRVIKSSYDGDIFNTKLSVSSEKKILLSSPSTWNKIYKTDLFRKNDIWFPARAWHEDVRTTLKIFTVIDSVLFVQEHLYYYVQRNDSITHNVNVERNREIIDAVNDVLSFYRKNGLFDTYHDELEYITIVNMYNAASARVAAIDPRNHLLSEFRETLVANFPNYKKNKYIASFSTRQKVLYSLVELRAYTLLKVLDSIRAKLDSRVK